MHSAGKSAFTTGRFIGLGERDGPTVPRPGVGSAARQEAALFCSAERRSAGLTYRTSSTRGETSKSSEEQVASRCS